MTHKGEVGKGVVDCAVHLHEIAMTNIVWCMAHKRQVGEGVVDCAIVVQ